MRLKLYISETLFGVAITSLGSHSLIQLLENNEWMTFCLTTPGEDPSHHLLNERLSVSVDRIFPFLGKMPIHRTKQIK